MAAILDPIYIDVKEQFSALQFFSATPAMKYDRDAGRFSDEEQDSDDDGRALYVVSLVAQYNDNWGNTKTDVLEVRVAEVRGEDPMKTCLGKEVELVRLRASNQAKVTRAGSAYLGQRLHADSIGPVESAARRRAQGADTDSAILPAGAK